MSSQREGGNEDSASPTQQVARVRVPGPEAGVGLTQPRHDQCVTSGVSCPGAGFLGNPGTHTPKEPPSRFRGLPGGLPGLSTRSSHGWDSVQHKVTKQDFAKVGDVWVEPEGTRSKCLGASLGSQHRSIICRLAGDSVPRLLT